MQTEAASALARARLRGIVLVAVSAVLWSTAGLFVRMAGLDTWTIIAWRSFFAALTLGCLLVARGRGGAIGRVLRGGKAAWISIAVSVVSSTTYVMSLRMTTVANVMAVYATLPFLTSAIAFLWVRERVTRRFLVAGGMAIVGVVIMAGASAAANDLVGIAAAFVMTAGFGFQIVLVKRHPGLDTMALSVCAAAACVPVALPFASAVLPAPGQLAACALYGALTTGLAYVLAMEGGRLVSAGEAGFISLLDVVLGPLWVWLAFAETPTPVVLTGGLIVLGSVAWYLAADRLHVARKAAAAG